MTVEEKSRQNWILSEKVVCVMFDFYPQLAAYFMSGIDLTMWLIIILILLEEACRFAMSIIDIPAYPWSQCFKLSWELLLPCELKRNIVHSSYVDWSYRRPSPNISLVLFASWCHMMIVWLYCPLPSSPIFIHQVTWSLCTHLVIMWGGMGQL